MDGSQAGKGAWAQPKLCTRVREVHGVQGWSMGINSVVDGVADGVVDGYKFISSRLH